MKNWIETDGSCSTLQYAKKIDRTKWMYRQWLDTMGSEYSCEYKINNWDSENWEEQIINLRNYERSEIESDLGTFGYKIKTWDKTFHNFVIEQGVYEYSVADSIQLACECIFELNN